MKKILLSVAGFDPSSGAGILLDIKVFQEFRFQGMAILTSLTAQSTKTVKKVYCFPSSFLWDQYQILEADVSFSGIKVGMVGSRENIPVIGKILSLNRNMPKVIDPIFKSSSGTWLLEKEAIPSYISEISRKASLITPNLEEAQLISGIKMKNIEALEEAAEKIYSQTNISCFIKGGNFKSHILDLLYDGKKFYPFESKRMKKKVHGTGCFLSSTILSLLAKGYPLEKACFLASKSTHQAMQKAIRYGGGQSIIPFPLAVR